MLLLVEDDVDHAFLVRRQMREQLAPELEIVGASTMAQATRRLLEGDVRCVMLDLSLPDAKGLEVLRAVRAAAPTVAVVVLTGTDSDELGREALALGAQDYLVKGQHGPDVVRRSVVFSMERADRQLAEQAQAALAHRLQLVLETSAEGICTLDDDGTISFANRTAVDLFGLPAEVLTGRALHDFHVCPAGECHLEQRLLSHATVDVGEQLFRSADGHVVLEVRVRPVQEIGSDIESVVCLTDVTSRRLAQDALAEREAQLVEAQQLAHLGSWEWVPDSDEVLWSDELYRVVGLDCAAVPAGRGAFAAYTALVPEGERAELALLFEGWTSTRPPVHVLHRLVRPDGQLRWLQCRASVREVPRSQAGESRLRVVGSVQDITEQKQVEDALAHQAMHDALTGLPNRVLLLDRLDRMLVDSRRETVAVLYMDIDRFKWVNDSISHAAGDELLIAVAERLAAHLRPTDTLARNGGDEFVMLCDGLVGDEMATTLAGRFERALLEPFVVEGHKFVVSMSMGLAIAAPGAEVDSESLIRDADIAMYRAKAAGGGLCEIFDEAMRDLVTRRLEIQAELHDALGRDEIKPWYQPIVDLDSGRVVGCEALARWSHPTRGLILPDVFIPHAEETGAIVELDGSILAASCRQLAGWNRARLPAEPLSLSVNVSARQLGSELLVATVRAALEDSGLDPRMLCLEVTESVIMQDVDRSAGVLAQLRELGIRTAVDDFGTGYSSLGYLLSLPVDVLKIDRSFVTDLTPAGPRVAIVRAIEALGHALGLTIIAEGVESMGEQSLLRDLGVDRVQGFLLGRAVPPEDADWALLPGGTP